MPKTPSDKLHHLVQSLSPSEKRYFRIFIRGRTERDNKYLQLFEALSDGEVFDEEKFKALIYRGEPVTGKKYSELKSYLYDLILKCLQNFDEQRVAENRVEAHLRHTAVLFRRGHYDDCRDLLQKARKIAVQYEYFSHHLEVIRWEKLLAYTQMDADFLDRHLEQLHFEENRVLEQLNNATFFRKIFFEVYAAIKKEAPHRDKAQLERLKNMIEQPDFQSTDRAVSHRARVQQLRALNLFHYAALDYKLFYESGARLTQLIESQPHFLTEDLSDYIAALSNLVLACGLLRKYDEVRTCLLKLRSLSPLTSDDRRKIHRQYYTNFFALCTYSGDFEAAEKEMRHCQAEAAGFDPRGYETASFYYQYALIAFGCNKFDDALHYLNEWKNQPRSVEREDLQSIARIFTLVLHVEMRNNVLLESLLRSASRYLRKKRQTQALEWRFVQFVSEWMRLPPGKNPAGVFEKMRDFLVSVQEEPATRALLQTFDLAAWIESKLDGRTFAAVVRDKWAV